MQVMKSIVDEQWQNNILIFSRVKQRLSFFKFNFHFHFEGYVCSVADGDKFIKTSRVHSRNLCIKHRAASKRFNLLTSFDEKMKETN